MKRRTKAILLAMLLVLCLNNFGVLAETASPQPTEAAQTEVAQEAEQTQETVSAEETTAVAETDEQAVEDPDFAGTSDPLATVRLIMAAVGAFAIAFMYSRSQRSKYRARNKKR